MAKKLLRNKKRLKTNNSVSFVWPKGELKVRLSLLLPIRFQNQIRNRSSGKGKNRGKGKRKDKIRHTNRRKNEKVKHHKILSERIYCWTLSLGHLYRFHPTICGITTNAIPTGLTQFLFHAEIQRANLVE